MVKSLKIGLNSAVNIRKATKTKFCCVLATKDNMASFGIMHKTTNTVSCGSSWLFHHIVQMEIRWFFMPGILIFPLGVLAVLSISFLEFVVGMLLSLFLPTRWAGINLWAMSGLFLKWLPKVCPADRCAHCRNWTCPRFHDAGKNEV